MSQRSVMKAMEIAHSASVCFISAGELTEQSLLRLQGMISKAELESLREAGAIGDTNGIFFDAYGKEVNHSLSERTIAVGLAELMKIKGCPPHRRSGKGDSGTGAAAQRHRQRANHRWRCGRGSGSSRELEYFQQKCAAYTTQTFYGLEEPLPKRGGSLLHPVQAAVFHHTSVRRTTVAKNAGCSLALVGRVGEGAFFDCGVYCVTEKTRIKFSLRGPSAHPCHDLARLRYVAFVINAFTQRIVGWKASRITHAALCSMPSTTRFIIVVPPNAANWFIIPTVLARQIKRFAATLPDLEEFMVTGRRKSEQSTRQKLACQLRTHAILTCREITLPIMSEIQAEETTASQASLRRRDPLKH